MNKDQIIEAIKAMSVLELNELVKACEEEFGVSAAAPVAVAGAAGAAEGGAAEQTEFTVVLKGSRRRKDQGYQGCKRNHRPGSEGSEGSRRRSSFQPQGKC